MFERGRAWSATSSVLTMSPTSACSVGPHSSNSAACTASMAASEAAAHCSGGSTSRCNADADDSPQGASRRQPTRWWIYGDYETQRAQQASRSEPPQRKISAESFGASARRASQRGWQTGASAHPAAGRSRRASCSRSCRPAQSRGAPRPRASATRRCLPNTPGAARRSFAPHGRAAAIPTARWHLARERALRRSG